MYVGGMCDRLWAIVYSDSGILGNVQFQVVNWFTITVLSFKRYLNLNCIILTVGWFRHTANIILYCCTCHLEGSLTSGRHMSVVTACQSYLHTAEVHLLALLIHFVHLINAWSLEYIKLHGSLLAHEGCVYWAHIVNICARCMIYADSYGASQELLLEATWKTKNRKMVKAAK
jgi:hypothetical protein